MKKMATVSGIGQNLIKKTIYADGPVLFITHKGHRYIVKLKSRHKILNDPPLYHETYEVVSNTTFLAWEGRIWNRFLSIA